jgi:hypothetical protein
METPSQPSRPAGEDTDTVTDPDIIQGAVVKGVGGGTVPLGGGHSLSSKEVKARCSRLDLILCQLRRLERSRQQYRQCEQLRPQQLNRQQQYDTNDILSVDTKLREVAACWCEWCELGVQCMEEIASPTASDSSREEAVNKRREVLRLACGVSELVSVVRGLEILTADDSSTQLLWKKLISIIKQASNDNFGAVITMSIMRTLLHHFWQAFDGLISLVAVNNWTHHMECAMFFLNRTSALIAYRRSELDASCLAMALCAISAVRGYCTHAFTLLQYQPFSESFVGYISQVDILFIKSKLGQGLAARSQGLDQDLIERAIFDSRRRHKVADGVEMRGLFVWQGLADFMVRILASVISVDWIIGAAPSLENFLTTFFRLIHLCCVHCLKQKNVSDVRIYDTITRMVNVVRSGCASGTVRGTGSSCASFEKVLVSGLEKFELV